MLNSCVCKVPFTSSGLHLAVEFTRSNFCKGNYARVTAAYGNIFTVSSVKYFGNNYGHASQNLFEVWAYWQVSILGSRQETFSRIFAGFANFL